MTQDQERRVVGHAVGETTFTEFIYRTTYPDGTSCDTPPRPTTETTTLGESFRKVLSNQFGKRGGRFQRLERVVTVTAGPWTQVDEIVVAAGAPPSMVAVPAHRDYCQRVTCGHAHAFHSDTDDAGYQTEDEHSGMCTRCGNPDKCRSFVAKKQA